MSTRVIDRIGKKLTYFYSTSGIKPTYIYLGREEFNAVKRETVLHRDFNLDKLSTITSLFGYEVYAIDADNHLSVGI